jgi:hypothetical protein
MPLLHEIEFPSTISWLVDSVIVGGHITPTGAGGTTGPIRFILAAAGTVPLTLLNLGAWAATFLLLIFRCPRANGIMQTAKSRRKAPRRSCALMVELICFFILVPLFQSDFSVILSVYRTPVFAQL